MIFGGPEDRGWSDTGRGVEAGPEWAERELSDGAEHKDRVAGDWQPAIKRCGRTFEGHRTGECCSVRF